MTKIPNRRRDRLLRETINEYRRMAEGAQKDAARSKNAAVKARYAAVAKSLTELADALQDRPSSKGAAEPAVDLVPKPKRVSASGEGR